MIVDGWEEELGLGVHVTRGTADDLSLSYYSVPLELNQPLCFDALCCVCLRQMHVRLSLLLCCALASCALMTSMDRPCLTPGLLLSRTLFSGVDAIA